ncbi:PucR family transcriptional regulator [Nocardia amikacinitolerans]|uniref:PucR family transcriptional regulator n=1 Tax=Nocardia amikacinitolerans TaxID=756689 RepID=UPI0020A38266|nr:helix-turn-helix domain-containing protein [Nocardia amikacinitolerans]
MVEQLWPIPSRRVRELISAIAEDLVSRYQEVLEQLWAASLRGPEFRVIADDPVLAEADRRLNSANLKQWLASNIQHPGMRVPTHSSPETLVYARDVVLRGLTTNDLHSWRAASREALHWWLDACFEATEDRDELRELVEVSANSMTVFVDDSIAEMAANIEKVRDELAGGAQLQRYATVELLLQGASIERARAEAQLGYALTGKHVAVIVWVDSEDDVTHLETAAEQVMRVCGAGQRLTVVAGTAGLWLWLPIPAVPPVADIVARLKGLDGARVAFGRPAADIAGFRRTHMDAAAAQRLLARLGSHLRVVRYEDVQLADLLSTNIALADQFIADTLGDLVAADPVLHQTTLAFVGESFNRSGTAEKLFTHRNTIDRRLARVDELLPRPLSQDPASVVAALTLLNIKHGA